MVNAEYLDLSNSEEIYCADVARPWLPSVWGGRECVCRLAWRQSDEAPVIIYVDGHTLLGVHRLTREQPNA